MCLSVRSCLVPVHIIFIFRGDMLDYTIVNYCVRGLSANREWIMELFIPPEFALPLGLSAVARIFSALVEDSEWIVFIGGFV